MTTRPTPPEPTPERLANPIARYLLATRPAFLSITLAGCLLGFATAFAGGAGFNAVLATATLLLALLAHAAINVLNDYCDHLNGSDERNTGRIYPFTGGSRFIQLTVAGGLWLLLEVGAGLFWIGLAGLVIGWGYSAWPLQLNSRGLGELCVVAGFLLIVAGADFVQRGGFASLPWLVALPYALLVANILYVNQFPDREADRASGKLHWVARLEPAAAAYGYGVLALLAAVALAVEIILGRLPVAAAVALLAFVPALAAWRQLLRFAAAPRQLAPAIRLTLLAGHALPLLLAVTLFAGGVPE